MKATIKTWKEYWVEYNWQDSKWGARPNNIQQFKSKAEANKFANTINDAKVVEVHLRQQSC